MRIVCCVVCGEYFEERDPYDERDPETCDVCLDEPDCYTPLNFHED